MDRTRHKVWNTDRDDWSNRPNCNENGGDLWCEANWGDNANPNYASLAFRPGLP